NITNKHKRPSPYATSSTVNPTPETGPPLFTTSKSDDTPSTTADLHPCPALNGTGPGVHVTCGRVARATESRTPTYASAAPAGAVTVRDTRCIAVPEPIWENCWTRPPAAS